MTDKISDNRRPRLTRSRMVLAVVSASLGCQPGGGQGSDGTDESTASAGSTGEMSTTDASDIDTPTTGGEPETTGGPEPVTWGECPAGYRDACATVEMPLDWSQPDGAVIPVFVARRLADAQPAKAQLWLVAGGPGQSADAFTPALDWFADALPDHDLYAIEHRGVGESGRLGCPAQEAVDSVQGSTIAAEEWTACAAHLVATEAARLPHLTVSNAARDLHAYIGHTRAPGQQVFVFSASYGTALAMRLLQLFPDAADGVVFDSLVAPGVQFMSQFDRQHDPVLKVLADLCADDPTCGEKLGPDPWAATVAALDAYEAGACAELGIPSGTLRRLLAVLVQNRNVQSDVFPLMYRLARCQEADVAVVAWYMERLVESLAVPEGQPAGRFSEALQTHITLSELWESPPPTLAEMQARCDDAVVCGRGALERAPVHAMWPRYTTDEHANAWPATEVPLLALNGTLDAQTPIATASQFKEHMTLPQHHFVSVPQVGHGVTRGATADDGATPCGRDIVASFLNSGGGAPDTSCLADLDPVDFAYDPGGWPWLFPVEDPWEGVPSDGYAPPASPESWRPRTWMLDDDSPLLFVR